MNVLLFSMPDSFEHMPSLTIRMPNGGLTSIAGNLDSHHRVGVADLILVQDRVRETVEDLVAAWRPDVVGLSVMTFQRHTARKVIELVRARHPAARIVVGGYDPSMAPDAYFDDSAATADYAVRSEGEITFRDLVRALEHGGDPREIPGLSLRTSDGVHHGPERPVHRLGTGELSPPRRDARILDGYTMMGRGVDVVETSRGCTFDCSFCSIIEMRGRNFHRYAIERVIDDIRDARDHGARVIFLVDDNITLDARRFEALCRAIVDAGLDSLDYIVQATTSSIANQGETLAPLMRRAGFRYVFLGIENILDEDLKFLKASSKNYRRQNGRRVGNATERAIEHVHTNGMYVVGGLIVGNPDDTRESIETNLEFARRHVDWPYIQHPTPYPRTPMTRELRERGLILHERLEEYDGTTAVVRTEHLDAEEVEFLRWKAERWMKARHFPVVLAHDPWYALRNGSRMFRHTFRGTTWKNLVGLEDARAAFRRYRERRAAERRYL